MAGTFTHLMICDVAKTRRSSIGKELYKLLNNRSEFLYLGAVSPDLPYLSFKTGNVNWADVMHYERTNSVVASGYDEIRATWANKTEFDEIRLAWLFGYVSHLVADSTIHPVVQEIVGPYDKNPDGHRLCEMTQDSLVFNKRRKTDISYAEFSEILKYCDKSPHFPNLMDFWKAQIINNYRDIVEEPSPDAWFSSYTKAIDLAEGGSAVVGLFRHLGIGTSYIYMTKDEILKNHIGNYEQYFDHVKLPHGGIGSFSSNGYEYAIGRVTNAWNDLYSGLISGTVNVAGVIKNWNLDTGVDMDSKNKEVTSWV
jgi:hypothetical protein